MVSMKAEIQVKRIEYNKKQTEDTFFCRKSNLLCNWD